MKEFRSFLSPQIHSFIRYRQASQRWNDSSYEENLMLFDHYCHANDPCATALTQEMVDGWCRQRRTETNNSCRSRIYVVDSFIRFLNMRGLSNVQPPQIPRKERRRYLPQKHLLLQKMRTISITRKNKIPETLVNKGLLGFCSLFKLANKISPLYFLVLVLWFYLVLYVFNCPKSIGCTEWCYQFVITIVLSTITLYKISF